MNAQERAVMQMALEALCMPCDRWSKTQAKIVSAAIESLTAALARPDADPVEQSKYGGPELQALILAELTAPVARKQQGCGCHACRPITFGDMRMVLCPTCGNKRCPHANNHQNDCTGSNQPGQAGSAYAAAHNIK